MSSISLIKVVGAFFQPKGQDQPLKKALGLEGGLTYIYGIHWNLVISGLQINLDKVLGPLELVKKVIIHGIGYMFLTVILFNA